MVSTLTFPMGLGFSTASVLALQPQLFGALRKKRELELCQSSVVFLLKALSLISSGRKGCHFPPINTFRWHLWDFLHRPFILFGA